MIPEKPKLSAEVQTRRRLLGLSYDDTRALAHRGMVAEDMLAAIKAASLKAVADHCVINPQSLADWIDDHAAQLDVATAVEVAP